MWIYSAISYLCLLHLQVIRHFDGCKADLVVCDGAPDGKAMFYYITSQPMAYSIKEVLPPQAS